MADATRLREVRISLRTAFAIVGALGATALALAVLASSRRVIGWMLVAAALAGLLHPVVVWLDRRMLRGLAVAAVAIALLGAVGVTGYALVDDITSQTERLETVATKRAEEIERSDRFGESAREFELAKRVNRFIAAIPERLWGGKGGAAIRTTTNRGLAFLATFVLTIFLLLQGARMKRGGIAQIRDPVLRDRVDRVVTGVYRRAFGYARGSLALAILTGLFAYTLARAADVPGAAALAVWVALWDLVPVFGFPIGVIPIVALAAFGSPITALLIGAAFVGYEVLEVMVLQGRIEARTMRLGRFLTVVAAFGGLELYGLAGALLAVLAMAGLVALVDELAPATPPP
jgi:predicted PurR-regulated permease PerM